MPWKETTPMHQRTLFIADHLRGTRSVTELCAEYGISRKTAYKWIDRYIRRGPAGLEDRSRRPRVVPNATAEPVVHALIALRQRHPTWGPRKLLAYLARRQPTWTLPGRSATAALLKRRGLIRRRTHRRVIGHPGKPNTLIVAPNQVWCADFKGQFRMGNGRYCYPLTVTDGFSRSLLGCHGLPSTAVQGAKPVFSRLFQEYGLPQFIRTDNGVPFATNTLARRSRLSAWWVRLGILPQLIEPGRPQQNGRHERMHKTLKQEATRPPAAAMPSQQRCFDRFRREFNEERPHEALEQRTPASVYQPSPRPMPRTLPPLEYPDRFEVRYVSANGGIRWNKAWVNVSTTCIGEYVGLEEIDDGVWNVYFGALKLGRLLERKTSVDTQNRPPMIT
jgi:transposase InsO family protein